MDPHIQQQLEEQNTKLDAILASVRKTEKYFKATLWITVIVFVLPLIAMVFIVPMAISSYSSTLNSLL
jgi:NADH:ubiquinone oxidoreductase subunit 3 (subunit A)